MYKPQYLNVERDVTNIYAGNILYYKKVKTINLGYKRKQSKKNDNKSGRRFK